MSNPGRVCITPLLQCHDIAGRKSSEQVAQRLAIYTVGTRSTIVNQVLTIAPYFARAHGILTRNRCHIQKLQVSK